MIVGFAVAAMGFWHLLLSGPGPSSPGPDRREAIVNVGPSAAASLDIPVRVDSDALDGEPGPIPLRVIDARLVPDVTPILRPDAVREAVTTLIVAPHLVLTADVERSVALNPRKVRFPRGLGQKLEALLVSVRGRAQELDAAIERSIDIEAKRAAIGRPSVWLDLEKPLDALRLGQLGANPVLRTRNGKLLGLAVSEAPETVLREAELHGLGRKLLEEVIAVLQTEGVLEEAEVEPLLESIGPVDRK